MRWFDRQQRAADDASLAGLLTTPAPVRLVRMQDIEPGMRVRIKMWDCYGVTTSAAYRGDDALVFPSGFVVEVAYPDGTGEIVDLGQLEFVWEGTQ